MKSQDQRYHIGNIKQANQFLTEILPHMEKIILNANKEFFTIKETMLILSISRTQLYYLRVKGILEYRHVGRKIYIPRTAIHAMVMTNGYKDVLAGQPETRTSNLRTED